MSTKLSAVELTDLEVRYTENIDTVYGAKFFKLLKIDWVLVLLLVLLVSIGCLSLYSAADGNWSPWASRHFQRGIIGILIALIIALIDIKIIYKFSGPLSIEELEKNIYGLIKNEG